MTVVGAIGQDDDPTLRIVGSHPLMEALREDIRRAARLDAPVVVWGPTGVGKELVARALHELSAARQRPFLPVMAALPESLVESELFGSIRGAFTGAVDRAGIFEAAAGGTVFLDEASDLLPGIQLKLLRVLEDGEVRRVGAAVGAPVSFRLVVAANESPATLLRGGRWRHDLYYRLAAIVLRVPTLSERRSDVPELVAALSQRLHVPQVEPEALELLTGFAWPGNVRQLRQVLLQLAHRADGARVHATDVARVLASLDADALGTESPAGASAGLAREALLAVCDQCAWDLARAAAHLGLSRATLYRRLRGFGINVRYERRARRPVCLSLTSSHEKCETSHASV